MRRIDVLDVRVARARRTTRASVSAGVKPRVSPAAATINTLTGTPSRGCA